MKSAIEVSTDFGATSGGNDGREPRPDRSPSVIAFEPYRETIVAALSKAVMRWPSIRIWWTPTAFSGAPRLGQALRTETTRIAGAGSLRSDHLTALGEDFRAEITAICGTSSGEVVQPNPGTYQVKIVPVNGQNQISNTLTIEANKTVLVK